MRFIFKFILIFIIVFEGCSSTKKVVKENENKSPSFYVFDDIEKIDSATVQKGDSILISKPKIKKINKPQYVVQLAAFSSKEKAEKFIDDYQKNSDYKMNIVFKKKLNIYAIQLSPFDLIEEAEKVRDKLQKFAAFKNSFIMTIGE